MSRRYVIQRDSQSTLQNGVGQRISRTNPALGLFVVQESFINANEVHPGLIITQCPITGPWNSSA